MPAQSPLGHMTWRVCAALFVAAALAACGPPKPPLLKANVMAGGDVNPDRNGRASPVVVRVYELKSVTAFNSADFFSIYDKENETLGADLNGKEELRLKPGETVLISHPLKPDTKFVAALAAFRELDKSRWRTALEVPPKKKTVELTIAIKGKTVGVTAAP
jgi:type VI secretion system protein VasD